MFNTKSLVTMLALAFAAGAFAQSNDLATGNMHFNAKDMDINGDHMISRDEFIQYSDRMWGMMSKGAATITINDADQAFARGNMRFSAGAMDVDHDGTISKEEFLAYSAKQFDKMKDKNGMMSVTDATRNFARGNMP